MCDLQRIGLVLTALPGLVLPTFAAEVNDGEMAAAIRSADYPCEHVLGQQATGDNDWRVQCNSGMYQVTRVANGVFSVVKTN